MVFYLLQSEVFSAYHENRRPVVHVCRGKNVSRQIVRDFDYVQEVCESLEVFQYCHYFH